MRVISLDVALQDVAFCSMPEIILPEELFKPGSGIVGSLPLLAGFVIVYKGPVVPEIS